MSCAQATEIIDNNNVSMEKDDGNLAVAHEINIDSIEDDNSYVNEDNEVINSIEDNASYVEVTNPIEDDNLSVSVSSENTPHLTKTVTIEYAKKTIDCSDTRGVYLIDNSYENIIFRNVTFKDTVLFKSNPNENLNENLNVTMIDCTFLSDEDALDSVISVDSNLDVKFSSNTISSQVKTLAESIVGESKGMEAIEKLAYWVTDNIAHESKDGFYQTPTETLKRKVGNCCCHSELFLQMCVAVGIDKEYELSFVHVGNMGYGFRHYFVLIDNICVDTDATLLDPMFYGAGLDWGVYEITKYPILPLY